MVATTSSTDRNTLRRITCRVILEKEALDGVEPRTGGRREVEGVPVARKLGLSAAEAGEVVAMRQVDPGSPRATVLPATL